MQLVIQYGLPALAVLVVGILAFVGQWAAPLRNDRALALQELDALDKMRKMGNSPGMTEAAADLGPVIRRRIQNWNRTTLLWYQFKRLALNALRFGLLIFCVDVAAIVFYIFRGDTTAAGLPVLEDHMSTQSQVLDAVARTVSVTIIVAAFFYLAAGLAYLWEPPKLRFWLRVLLSVLAVAALVVVYLGLVDLGRLLRVPPA